MRAHIHTHTHTHMHKRARAHRLTHTHTHTHLRTHACTHAHTHTSLSAAQSLHYVWTHSSPSIWTAKNNKMCDTERGREGARRLKREWEREGKKQRIDL